MPLFAHTLLALLLPFVSCRRNEPGADQDIPLSSANGHADGEAFDRLPMMVQELKEAADTGEVQEVWKQSQELKETASELQEVRESKKANELKKNNDALETNQVQLQAEKQRLQKRVKQLEMQANPPLPPWDRRRLHPRDMQPTFRRRRNQGTAAARPPPMRRRRSQHRRRQVDDRYCQSLMRQMKAGVEDRFRKYLEFRFHKLGCRTHRQ